MIQIQGFYYDGKRSGRDTVIVSFYESGGVVLKGGHHAGQYDVKELRIMPRIANTPRCVYFPDGSKFETNDNSAVDHVSAHFQTHRWHRWVNLIENNYLYVGLALLASAAFIWASINYVIPFTAKMAAQSIPIAIEMKTGNQSLEVLDEFLFKPSQLTPDVTEHIQSQFDTTLATLSMTEPYRLLFRSSPEIGANAFTLPGGIIIVMDDLVDLAVNDQQLFAVIAHEMGHVHHQHIMRRFFQNSITALLLASVLGDVSSVSSFAATVPTFLVETHYSREFELEADAFALHALQRLNISHLQFSEILQRLGAQNDVEEGNSFLSSHPSTHLRIELINK